MPSFLKKIQQSISIVKTKKSDLKQTDVQTMESSIQKLLQQM